jgi:hypothetical protein
VPPCEREIEKIKLMPLKIESLEERWPTSGWRSPASSSSRAQRALRPRPTPPPSRLQTPPRRAGTSAACAASSVDCPAAGASALAPGACSSAASVALDEGGAGSHLSGGAPPPPPRRCCPPPLLPPPTSPPRSPGEKVPAARAAGTPHPSVPGAPAAGSFSPFCAPPAPASAAAPRARTQGVGGSDCAASTANICGG